MFLQLEMSFPRLQQDSVTQREGRTENLIGPDNDIEFLKHFMNILLKIKVQRPHFKAFGMIDLQFAT